MIYKRKDSPYWWAGWYVKAADGRLVSRAISTKIRRNQDVDGKKAKEFEADMKRTFTEFAEKKRLEQFITDTAEIMTAKVIPSIKLPVSLVWDKYSFDTTQKNRAKRTQSSKKQAWNRFVLWLGKEHPEIDAINDISRETAKEYLEGLENKASSTFNNNKNSLSSVWKVLTVTAGLKENIWRLFPGAEDDSVRYRDFSLEEVKSLIAVADEFWRVAVAVGFYTGLRFVDVAFLSKSQIHGDYIILPPIKTRRNRKSVHVYIHPSLKKILDYQISIAKDDYLFPEAVAMYGTHAFQLEFGKLLDKVDEGKGKKAITKDERGGVGFHSLRHTFVTQAEEAGIERKVVQGIVGHGSPVMTGHYSHDLKSIKQIEKLPSLLAE
ncbi:MAG: tyrosine-type recombinase/integrase [Lentisphaerota bacterium]